MAQVLILDSNQQSEFSGISVRQVRNRIKIGLEQISGSINVLHAGNLGNYDSVLREITNCDYVFILLDDRSFQNLNAVNSWFYEAVKQCIAISLSNNRNEMAIIHSKISKDEILRGLPREFHDLETKRFVDLGTNLRQFPSRIKDNFEEIFSSPKYTFNLTIFKDFLKKFTHFGEILQSIEAIHNLLVLIGLSALFCSFFINLISYLPDFLSSRHMSPGEVTLTRETPVVITSPSTETPLPTKTDTPTAINTPTPTAFATVTLTYTETPTTTTSPRVAPTLTATATATDTTIPTSTHTTMPTATVTPPPTNTHTAAPTATLTPSPTDTHTATATETRTQPATVTAAPTTTPTKSPLLSTTSSPQQVEISPVPEFILVTNNNLEYTEHVRVIEYWVCFEEDGERRCDRPSVNNDPPISANEEPESVSWGNADRYCKGILRAQLPEKDDFNSIPIPTLPTDVEWEWVKGHKNEPYNPRTGEFADKVLNNQVPEGVVFRCVRSP